MRPPLSAVWRALPHRVLVGGCAAALLLGGASASWVDDTGDSVLLLRGAIVLLASTMAFALDDAAATVLASSPTTLRRRAGLALGLCAAAVLATWAVLVVEVLVLAGGAAVLGLTVELVALCALAVAAAAGLRAWRAQVEPGVLAAPFVLATLVGVAALPARLDMLHPHPDWPGWDGAVLRWAAVAAVMAAVVVRATRDPAAR